MKNTILFAIIASSINVEAQNITTFGGGGGAFCEECSATSCAIPNPIGGIFDKFGNYYFASGVGGNRIRRINTAGIITTVAGNGVGGFLGDGGMATSAHLKHPAAVKLDTSGNIYISDFQNFRIRKVDVFTGVISTIAGNGTFGYNGDGIPATDAMIFGGNICLDRAGNIYVSEYNGRRVRKINTSGIISTIAGTGAIGSSGDGGQATNAELSPNGVTIDDAGNIYIADPHANVVRKIDVSGNISTIAGNGGWIYVGDGIPATDAQIQPTHISHDMLGNIYVGDKVNKRVYKITPTGMLYCVAGNGMGGFSGDGGPATSATLAYPSGISIDPCGNLFITEADNNRIRKVTFNPPPCEYLSVNEQSVKKEVSIYPNPANDELHVKNIETNTTYDIINVVGSVVRSGYLKVGNNSISVQQLPQGIYLLALTTEEGKRTVHKIVKE